MLPGASRLGGVILLLLSFTLAAPAGADSNINVAVIPPSTGPDLIFTARGLAETIADVASRDTSSKVMTADAVEKKLGQNGFASLIDCGLDSNCIIDRAEGLPVGSIIVGTLSRNQTAYRVTLVQIDLDSRTILATAEREVLIASRQLQAEVASAAAALLRGEAELMGTLLITTEQPGAAVTVDDLYIGKSPVQLKVKPGKHKVALTKSGYLDQDDHFVEVPAGVIVEHRVKLYGIPGRTPPLDATADLAYGTPAASAPFPLWPCALALAVGAAGITAGVVQGVTVSRYNAKAADANRDGVLEVSRAEANGAGAAARRANAFFIAGGVATAAGLGFLIWHISDNSTASEPTLAVTPNGMIFAGRWP